MALPNPDPSNPALPAPVFADTDAGRGDHLRLNNQKVWQNEEYLDNGGNINDAAAATPADADKAGFWQTAGAGLKNVTFAKLFVWVVGKVYALTGKTTPADADQLLITDSAASNVGKSLTFANLFLWVGAKIAALTGKTTPADADTLPLTDSAASNVQKNVTFANLFVWVVGKVYALTGKTTPADADQFLITDSAASNVGKSLTWANIKAALAPTYITEQATPTRVTATPTAIGEYRSYLRNADARTYTETNGTPAAAPSSLNGYKLYTSADFETVDSNAAPSRYEIYIGLGKVPVFEFYLTTGRTGYIGVKPFQRSGGYDVNGGCEAGYDPTTGIARVSHPPYQDGNNYTGLDVFGLRVSAAIYFDIKC